MTIALTGAGSLFVRIGHVLGPAADLLALMGGPATSNITSGFLFPARFTTINTDTTNGTGLPKLLARTPPYQALAGVQQAQGVLFQWLQQYVKDILGAMYNLDQSLPEDAPYNVTAALKYLITQMTGSTLSSPTATVQACTLSLGAQTAVNTPIGNPIIVLSTKNTQGLTLQLVFPEVLRFTTTRDQQGGATAGNEQISVAGQPAQTNAFSQAYPGGSGATGNYNCVDGSKSNSTGNLLQNSDFAVATASTADNWVYTVGVVTTDIITDSGNAYTTGGGSLKFIGTGGAVLDAVTQSFNTTPVAGGGGGTTPPLVADTQYAVNCWIKTTSVPAVGVFELALIDGAGNVLADDNGTNNLTTFDLTAGGLNVGNTYVNVNTTFRTPKNMTTQTTPFKLRVRLSTAITNGKNLWIGRLAMAAMTPLYPGGPPCAIFSGNTATINGLVPDQWTITNTNTYGLIQRWMDRIFGLRALNLQLPYTGSPSVADTLIA
jgi:hypothetical protein